MKTLDELFLSFAQSVGVLLDLTAELNDPRQISPGIAQLFCVDGVWRLDHRISNKAFDLVAQLD